MSKPIWMAIALTLSTSIGSAAAQEKRTLTLDGRTFAAIRHDETFVLAPLWLNLTPTHGELLKKGCAELNKDVEILTPQLKSCNRSMNLPGCRFARARLLEQVSLHAAPEMKAWVLGDPQLSPTEAAELTREAANLLGVTPSRVKSAVTLKQLGQQASLRWTTESLSSLLGGNSDIQMSNLHDVKVKSVIESCDLLAGRATLQFNGESRFQVLNWSEYRFTLDEAWQVIQDASSVVAHLDGSPFQKAAIVGARIAIAMQKAGVSASDEAVLQLMEMIFDNDMNPKSISKPDELEKAFFRFEVTVDSGIEGKVENE